MLAFESSFRASAYCDNGTRFRCLNFLELPLLASLAAVRFLQSKPVEALQRVLHIHRQRVYIDIECM